MTNVREPDAGARSLSGECRIEAFPVNGQALLIDGLRLQLDLRLAPSAIGANAPPPALAHQVQKLAAVAALGALLTALAVWFWGAPGAPIHALPPLEPAAVQAPLSTAPPPSASVREAPPVSKALPSGLPGALVPPAASGQVARLPDTAAGGSTSVRVLNEPVKPLGTQGTASASQGGGVAAISRSSAARPGRTTPSQSAGNAVAPVHPAPATSSLTSSLAVSPPTARNRDLLDLFGDTK